MWLIFIEWRRERRDDNHWLYFQKFHTVLKLLQSGFRSHYPTEIVHSPIRHWHSHCQILFCSHTTWFSHEIDIQRSCVISPMNSVLPVSPFFFFLMHVLPFCLLFTHLSHFRIFSLIFICFLCRAPKWSHLYSEFYWIYIWSRIPNLYVWVSLHFSPLC